MDFFYDLNKKMAALAAKQDADQLNEDKGVKPDFLDIDHDDNRKESFKKAVADKEEDLEESTGDYSAKKARAGKDIGKPGKQFAKIAKSAGERYGSKERGEKVAGAVLAKLRKGAKSVEEGDMEEGNAFSKAVVDAKKDGIQPGETIKVGGKEYPVKEEKHARSKGTAFDIEFMKKEREKAAGTGKFDVKDTGYSKRYTRKEEPEADEEEVSDTPKKKGRPKGPAKGPERVTAKAYKYKKPSDRLKKGEIYRIEKATKPDDLDEGSDKCCPHCGHSLVDEVAPPTEKAERMVKHIKKGYAKDGKLTPKEKSIAYATAWKAHKAGKVEEESTEAPAEEPKAPKAKKGGIQFGKGVYESINSKYEQLLTESMNITANSSRDDNGHEHKELTVTASGDDVMKLAELLNLAGIEAKQDSGCGCGTTPCSCEPVDEAYGDNAVTQNKPDYPTDEETTGKNDPHLRRWAGGLNKPKSTGQTTIPVIASQISRQVSETSDLGMNLYKELQQFKKQ